MKKIPRLARALATLVVGVLVLTACAADPAPDAVAAEVTAISPTAGALVSGGTVTITGEGLASVTRVTFAGVAATDVTAVSDTQVTAVVPVAADYVPAAQAVAVFVADTAVATPAGLSYERAVQTPVDAQLAYAFAHWSLDTYNLATYGEFNSVGGDCMNFVSQTLVARGIPQTDGWNFTSPTEQSGSWIYTPSFENYLLANPQLGFTRLTVDQRDQVAVGDIVVFDWNDNDSADHIQIVSDVRVVDGEQQILMVGHNLDSDWRDFDTVITVDHPGALAWFWKVPATAA